MGNWAGIIKLQLIQFQYGFLYLVKNLMQTKYSVIHTKVTYTTIKVSSHEIDN